MKTMLVILTCRNNACGIHWHPGTYGICHLHGIALYRNG